MLKSAIELLFDETTEARLDGVLRSVRDAGLPSPLLDWKMRPHVTLDPEREGWDRLVSNAYRTVVPLVASSNSAGS